MSNGVWSGGRGLIPFAEHRKARIKREKKLIAKKRAAALYGAAIASAIRNQKGWDQLGRGERINFQMGIDTM